LGEPAIILSKKVLSLLRGGKEELNQKKGSSSAQSQRPRWRDASESIFRIGSKSKEGII